MTRTLHVETWGDVDAPRVVCLHGVTGRGAGWHRLATGWLSDYHVLAPDLIGHGASPHEPPWSIAEHLNALVATLGTEPAAWIGHSFGGRLVLELAARRPSLVERLVLLDPAISLDPVIALHVAELARDDRSYTSFEEGVERRFEESGLRRTPRESVVEDLEGFLVADHDGRWRYRYSQAAVVASYGEMAARRRPSRTSVSRPSSCSRRTRTSATTTCSMTTAPRSAISSRSSPSPAATPCSGTRSRRPGRRSPRFFATNGEPARESASHRSSLRPCRGAPSPVEMRLHCRRAPRLPRLTRRCDDSARSLGSRDADSLRMLRYRHRSILKRTRRRSRARRRGSRCPPRPPRASRSTAARP